MLQEIIEIHDAIRAWMKNTNEELAVLLEAVTISVAKIEESDDPLKIVTQLQGFFNVVYDSFRIKTSIQGSYCPDEFNRVVYGKLKVFVRMPREYDQIMYNLEKLAEVMDHD